jgi:hypothetical protein
VCAKLNCPVGVPRWACFGELVKIATSAHDWREGRGEKAYLNALIDDATSRIFMRCYEADNIATDMAHLKASIEHLRHPLAGRQIGAVSTVRLCRCPSPFIATVPPSGVDSSRRQVRMTGIVGGKLQCRAYAVLTAVVSVPDRKTSYEPQRHYLLYRCPH